MDVGTTLRQAWAAVEEANLPEKIHEVAFREAVRILSPTTAAQAQRRPSDFAKSGTSKVSDETSGSGVSLPINELITKVATQTGVDADALEDLVSLDEGSLRIDRPALKLGRNNAERTRAIAIIFTVVRSYGMNEDDTSVELVRQEAIRLKCYDQGNFASYLKVINGFVLKGTAASNRRIQAKSAGVAEFGRLVEKLTGES